jgi:hypothetical protein
MVGKIVSITVDFTPTATTTPPPTTTAAGPVVLTVTSGTQTKTFSMAQVKALTVYSGYAGQKSKSGTTTGPVAYKGVKLTDLLAAVGGLPNGASVKITAKDGFSKTLTYDQIATGAFSVYDKTGAAATAEMTPTPFIVYEADGKALDDTTGPLQLGIMTCQNQVTDGSWWVKGVVTVEVVAP